MSLYWDLLSGQASKPYSNTGMHLLFTNISWLLVSFWAAVRRTISCRIYADTDNRERWRIGERHRRSFHADVHIWDARQRHADHRASACGLQRISTKRLWRWRSFFTSRLGILRRPTSTVTVDIITNLSRTAGVHWSRHLQKLHLYMQRR